MGNQSSRCSLLSGTFTFVLGPLEDVVTVRVMAAIGSGNVGVLN